MVITKQRKVMVSNSLEKITNHSEEQVMDYISAVPDYFTRASESQIHESELVFPINNKCKIGLGQAIIVTDKYIQVMGSNSWERITDHCEEPFMAHISLVPDS